MAASSKGNRTPGPSTRTAAPNSFEREFPGGSESANATVVALVRAGDALMAMANQALRHHGLSAAGRQALAILEGAGEPLSPTTIAERLIVTTATVTSLLDTLEKRGLVVRQPDPADRRKLLVSITDEARAIVDQFLPEVVALQTAVMAEPHRTAATTAPAVTGRRPRRNRDDRRRRDRRGRTQTWKTKAQLT